MTGKTTKVLIVLVILLIIAIAASLFGLPQMMINS